MPVALAETEDDLTESIETAAAATTVVAVVVGGALGFVMGLRPKEGARDALVHTLLIVFEGDAMGPRIIAPELFLRI